MKIGWKILIVVENQYASECRLKDIIEDNQ